MEHAKEINLDRLADSALLRPADAAAWHRRSVGVVRNHVRQGALAVPWKLGTPTCWSLGALSWYVAQATGEPRGNRAVQSGLSPTDGGQS